MTEPTEYPCKVIPGNVWYSFTAHGHTIGHSGPPGLRLRLVDEETSAGWTLSIAHEDGTPVRGEDGHPSALAVDRPARAPRKRRG